MAPSWLRRLASAASLVVVVGCQTTSQSPTPSVPEPRFHALKTADIPELIDDGDAQSLKAALEQNLAWLARIPGTRRFKLGPKEFTAETLTQALAEWRIFLDTEPTPEQQRRFLLERFEIYQRSDDGHVMATGYYVPEVEGSLVKDPAYPIPVYGVPANLIALSLGDFAPELAGRKLLGRIDGRRFVPYWDRAAIRRGKAEGQGLEPIAWVKDEFSLFVVEIQGSGILRTATGEERILGYAGQNGHPYRAIGKLLINDGKIPREKMSMAAIRNYLARHPAELDRVLTYNPSYVFFELREQGVLGSLGVPLTPRRSVATDHKVLPPGLPLFLEVARPSVASDGEVTSKGLIRRFVLSQDTGGAIRGSGRLDFFWGSGVEAETMASLMQHAGRLIALVPRERPRPNRDLLTEHLPALK